MKAILVPPAVTEAPPYQIISMVSGPGHARIYSTLSKFSAQMRLGEHSPPGLQVS